MPTWLRGWSTLARALEANERWERRAAELREENARLREESAWLRERDAQREAGFERLSAELAVRAAGREARGRGRLARDGAGVLSAEQEDGPAQWTLDTLA